MATRKTCSYLLSSLYMEKTAGRAAGQWTDTQQPISTTIIIGLLRDWRTASSR